MTTAGDFRGQGWRMPILPDAAGGLGYIDGDDNIVQSVELSLRTVAGERVMRPNFGTTVADLLFAADSAQNLHRLEVAVDDAIKQWEPRVEVDQVQAVIVGDTQVDVTVDYRILRTNTKRNLVFPYYMESGAAP
jgi:phage baseplate assembly protein W